jgi:hypothetical protein
LAHVLLWVRVMEPIGAEMPTKLAWIVTGMALGLSGAASAAVEAVERGAMNLGATDHRTLPVQERHYAGAEAPGQDVCSMPEPSKLGLLRSNTGATSKIKVLCKKLKA